MSKSTEAERYDRANEATVKTAEAKASMWQALMYLVLLVTLCATVAFLAGVLWAVAVIFRAIF